MPLCKSHSSSRCNDAATLRESRTHHAPFTRRRVVETYLTQQGESLLKKGDRIAEQIEAQAFSGFSAEEQEQFNQYLLRCSANLNSDEYRQEQ